MTRFNMRHVTDDDINQFLMPVRAHLEDPARLESRDELRAALSEANALIAQLISDRNMLAYAVARASKEMTTALTLHSDGDAAGLRAHLDEVLEDVSRSTASRGQPH